MGDAGERLKAARQKAGYTSAKSAAEAMGVPVPTYIQHENGARGFPAERAQRYGRFFRIAPEFLLYGKQSDSVNAEPLGPALHVKGEVAAGVWREAWELDPDEWEVFTGRSDIKAPLSKRFGLRVVGESMNDVYPAGSILECVMFNGDRAIESGRRVVVQRTRMDGTLETTVKELVRDPDGIEWLIPRSSNPSFLPFRADQPDAPDISRIEVIALVVGSYRPE